LRLTATKKYVVLVFIDEELKSISKGRALAVDLGVKGLLTEIEKQSQSSYRRGYYQAKIDVLDFIFEHEEATGVWLHDKIIDAVNMDS